MRATILSLFFVSLFGLLHAKTCLYCIGAPNISECSKRAVCGDNEECYLDKYLGVDMIVRYDAGCRSKQICGASHARRKRQLVICTDCCSDAPDIYGPCNSKLCGLTPTTENYECLVCAGVLSDVNSCSTTSVCPPREACFSGIRIVGTAIRYVVGCYDERVCHAIVENDGRNGTHGRRGRVIHGDQGTRICDACCKGDRCNAAGCFELRKNMTAAEYSNSLGPAFG